MSVKTVERLLRTYRNAVIRGDLVAAAIAVGRLRAAGLL